MLDARPEKRFCHYDFRGGHLTASTLPAIFVNAQFPFSDDALQIATTELLEESFAILLRKLDPTRSPALSQEADPTASRLSLAFTMAWPTWLL
jgi:hypothetical protein